ncbi:hypothetical protein [Pseudomonas anguilliseptica]|uniref:GGDEF domain-containing protein n=1 Tax=Pseudomonas anguilliseptica TaxID=53406 RepID=A0A1H4S973_PSEAG|nr:hypothetical protein [Pseudomonas anguilliseptica]SEC40401.1 hypothetical protein SAMN05421553_0799 [Pseudomonas anguilliseptica]
MRPDLQAPLRLAGVYLLFSVIWVISSDYLFHGHTEDTSLLAELHLVEVLLFVLLSAGLVFLVSYRDRQAQRSLLDEITQNSRLLQQTQRNAALGSWEYRNGFHLSEEALKDGLK